MGNTSMLPIREFAAFTGIPESTLRYYDKIGLLSPEVRGRNRYRFYSPLQTITVEFIKLLSRIGVPLTAIKEMSQNRTPQRVLEVLAKQEQILDAQLRELQTAYSIIHTYRENISAGIQIQENGLDKIYVQELAEANIILGQIADFSKADTFYAPFMKFCLASREKMIDLHYPIGGYYETMDSFMKAPGQPTRFFSLDPRGNSTRSAGQYLIAHCVNFYGDFGDSPQKMLDYARANKLLFTGPLYIIYLLDEISQSEHTHYVSRLMARVSKA